MNKLPKIAVFFEDSPFATRLLDDLTMAFNVQKTNSGDQLVEFARNSSTKLIVIITSSDSNELWQVCRQIRASRNGRLLPMVVILRKYSASLEESWFNAGIDDLYSAWQNSAVIIKWLNRKVEQFNYLQKLNSSRLKLQINLKQTANELTETRYEIVQRLSKAAEHRDPETGDHIHRMSLRKEIRNYSQVNAIDRWSSWAGP